MITFFQERAFHLYNPYHLGDNVFNILFFNKIASYLKKKGWKIEYYLNSSYQKQVSEFIWEENKDIILLHDLEEKPEWALEAWINNSELVKNFELQTKIGFDTYYIYFMNCLCKKMEIDYIIMDLKFRDLDFEKRWKQLIVSKPDLQNIQILIINSEPLSGQYKVNRIEWNRFIQYLHTKYNIITTFKVPNIPCTMDEQWTIKDIASISTKVEYIIAINTGPFVGCYNIDTLNHVKKIYIFVNNLHFDHPKIHTLRDIEELYLSF
jgi:hypothetical protein